MRVLLDECLPRKLKYELPGHEVKTVPEAGWPGKKNGELFRLAGESFDAFVTIDRSLRYQQNLAAVQLAIVLLIARDRRLETLLPLMGEVQERLSSRQRGAVVRIGARSITPPSPQQPIEE